MTTYRSGCDGALTTLGLTKLAYRHGARSPAMRPRYGYIPASGKPSSPLAGAPAAHTEAPPAPATRYYMLPDNGARRPAPSPASEPATHPELSEDAFRKTQPR